MMNNPLTFIVNRIVIFFTTILIVLFILLICLSGCEREERENVDYREDLYGTYTGTIDGDPINGTLTLFISKSEGSIEVLVRGSWKGQYGLVGKINDMYVSCSIGVISLTDVNRLGLSLTGPKKIICPAGTEGTGGCYSEVTLGEFEGKISKDGGTGTWHADSGAAQYVGVVGSGSWTVTRTE